MLDFEKYQEQISGICKKHRVRNLTAFGSAVSVDFTEQSDIDSSNKRIREYIFSKTRKLYAA